jgi:hypothetical protein
MRIKSIWILVFFCVLSFSSALIASPVQEVSEEQSLSQKINSFPYEEIDNNELNSIQFVFEFQKLTKDVFLKFYDLWRLPLFINLSHDVQQQMDELDILLKKYDLSVNLKKQEGNYFNSYLKKLYRNFTTTGKTSLFESLRVCATIEDLKIFDTNLQLDRVDNQDIKHLYTSYIHDSRDNIQKIQSTLEYYDQKLDRNLWLW